jgi:hypothetical protein
MTYAHQGVELRTLPGLPPPTHAPAVADASFKGAEEPHPVLLTRKGTDALVRVERMLDDANRAITARGAPPGPLGALDGGKSATAITTFATAADHDLAAASHGD